MNKPSRTKIFIATMMGVSKSYTTEHAANAALAVFIKKYCDSHWSVTDEESKKYKEHFYTYMALEDYRGAVMQYNVCMMFHSYAPDRYKAIVQESFLDMPF